MVIVVFANYALLNPLIVRGNAGETARNIMAHETQFRVAATCFLTYSVSVVVLLAALYVILKPVNQGLALVGALFRLVFALLWLLSTLNMLGALRLLGDAELFASLRTRPIASPGQGYPSPQLSTTTTSVCHFLDWPRPFAPGCGSSRTTSRKDWLSSV